MNKVQQLRVMTLKLLMEEVQVAKTNLTVGDG